ncbi:MAG TPA: hypothetical protein PKA27_02295 [Fimbriimonadaceae bacterium]|nr:hypothetical protein [Fimbriimonadaceae bacterium]
MRKLPWRGLRLVLNYAAKLQGDSFERTPTTDDFGGERFSVTESFADDGHARIVLLVERHVQDFQDGKIELANLESGLAHCLRRQKNLENEISRRAAAWAHETKQEPNKYRNAEVQRAAAALKKEIAAYEPLIKEQEERIASYECDRYVVNPTTLEVAILSD